MPSAHAPLRRFLERDGEHRRIGPFVLVEQLGRGGAAPVWLAKEMHGHTELRRAAMKLFALGRGGTTGNGVASLRRKQIVAEARALCRVEHPNIVRFYALCTDDELGVMGLAMELVAGVSLDAQLAQRGTLSIAESLQIGASIASALTAVHRAGLVHRDVKPANIVDAGGVHKLIDFGIAAADAAATDSPADDDRPAMIAVMLDDLPLDVVSDARQKLAGAVTLHATGGGGSSGAAIGTPGYIDPVCISRRAPAGPASDLYALGVTLFECVSGRLPSAAIDAARTGLRSAVLDGSEAAPALATVLPSAPPDFCRLVDSLLQADPTRRPRSTEWVATELARLCTTAAVAHCILPDESIGPFRGLGRFEAADREVYFGRTSEIATCLELLRSSGLVALVGPSGSGKSSLARAGVLPRLSAGDLGGWPSEWRASVIEPGIDPRGAVLHAFAEAGVPISDLAKDDPIGLLTELAEHAHATATGLVLLVDQLEELVTVSEEASRSWMVDFLSEVGERPLPGLRVLLAVRRDLLDPLLALGGLGRSLIRGMLLVEPIGARAWHEVLQQALGAYGYAFEDALLEEKVSTELQTFDATMPLVQFALTELWARRDESTKKITHAGFTAIGGITGALQRHADATLAEIARGDRPLETQARAILLALTTPRGTRATRTVEDLVDGRAARSRIVEKLEQARLIVRSEEGVTLAHESLLVQWSRLRDWVSEARESRVLAEDLERDAARWHADPESPLWSRRRLQLAEGVETAEVDLSSIASTFLAASRQAEQRARWAWRLVTALAVLLSAVAGGIFIRSARASEQAALDRARSEEGKRMAIDAARAEATEKQATIDQLVRQLSDAQDDETVLALQRKLKEASEPATDLAKPAARALAVRPTAGPRPSAKPPASATVGPTPSLKPQDWN